MSDAKMMSQAITELQAARADLESQLRNTIWDFEKAYGVTVHSIHLHQGKAVGDRSATTMAVEVEVRL